ncbi:Ankyrin repeat-containing protein [Rutstroemia sp. NJR-2017a BVV2]|nr:Ankyrin repeat-containing protein [Rutstroemia sp. NJR-2017a BVV2]
MSKPQYETMFKKWNFRKNIAAREWSSVNRCIEYRRAHDKDSTITIGGFQVNRKRIERARARRANAHSQTITVRTPPPPDLDFRHKFPDDLPWFCFLSKYNDKPMYLSASILNTGREIIRSSGFGSGHSEIPIPISAIHRTMQQQIFGLLRPLFLSKPDGYPTINLEQAFGLTPKTPHFEFLKLAIYTLSNNIQLGNKYDIGMKMVELCHSPGILQFLKRLLADKEPTLRVMAEKFLVCAIYANDKMLTQILLEAGASPKAILNYEDALSLAIRLRRTELLPFLICAGAREDDNATQLALEELEDISFKGLLKLSLETKQPHVAKGLLMPGVPISDLYHSSLLYYALNGYDVEIVELVLNYEAGRLWRSQSMTCLEVACSTGNIQKVRLLLQNIERIRGDGCVGFRKCLPYAVQSGNRQLVERLLIHGARINDISSSGISCLQLVDMNDLPMIQYLLDHGADPNHSAVGYGTPLHYAARSGNLAAVKLLFCHGAKLGPISGSLDPQDDIVRDAVLSGNIAVVEEILKAGAAADVWINDEYATALQLASGQGSIDIVRLLLTYNANINEPRGRGWHCKTALTAALCSRNIQLISYLLDQGANVNNPPDEHETPSPLQVCIRFLDYEMMVQGLERGADPEDSGALWVAVLKKDLRSVNLLLDLNRKLLSQTHLPQRAGSTDYGRAALSEAILGNQSELVCTLLEAGVDFKRRPTRVFGLVDEEFTKSSSLSATLAAIQVMNLILLQTFLSQGKHRLREHLLENGGDSELLLAMHSINFNHKDALEILKLLNGTVAEFNSYPSEWNKKGQTVLQKAILDGCCPSVVNYLLSIGANINSPAAISYGRTALQMAAQGDRDDIVEILIRNGASVNAIPSSYRGATAFQFAAMKGNFKIVQLLLEAGADAFAPRGKHYGRTAIEGAAENGRLDMVSYLLHLANGVDGVDFEHQLCRARRLSQVEELNPSMDCDSPNFHNNPTHSDCLRPSGDEDIQHEITEKYQTATDNDPNLPECMGTSNQERENDLIVDPDQLPDDYLTNFLDIPGSMATPQWNEFEITENYQTATDNDPNLPESMATLTQEREDEPMVYPNLFPDDYLTDFLDIPGSMATPRWDNLDTFYDADMDE